METSSKISKNPLSGLGLECILGTEFACFWLRNSYTWCNY